MNWLPLNEYSNKYQVSISTLRRRIKEASIQFQFQDGRYFIVDEPLQKKRRQSFHRPSQMMHTHEQTKDSGPSLKQDFADTTETPLKSEGPSQEEILNEPVLRAANKLLSEIKRAYSLILQEKEEQILQLKEEVTDLRTLVRVLEGEIARLKELKS